MPVELWWCRICHRRISAEELQPVAGPAGLFPVNHTETVVRRGQPRTIRHTVERRQFPCDPRSREP